MVERRAKVLRLGVLAVRGLIRSHPAVAFKDTFCPHFVPDPLDRCGLLGYITGVGGRFPRAFTLGEPDADAP